MDHACHRCMQPVPQDAARCPHCGMPQVRSHRVGFMIALASFMVLAALLTVVLMLTRAPASPPPPPPANDTTQSAPANAPPPPPDKPAPLDR